MRPEVSALFREVADRSPEQRHEYYIREQVPEALRAEVESLLEYDDQSSDSDLDSAQRRLVPETESRTREDAVRPPAAGLPDRIGRFEVTKLLGRGGMGEVYLARDPVIDRLVAIKLIGSGLEAERGRRRLLREARAAGRLHHSNIVTVFEAGEFEDRAFIAMEYVSGETLGRMIRRWAAVSLRQRIEMIEGACAGLAHAHRAGVIHLDIKPDNLMRADTGVVKVLDFGISRVLQNPTMATAQGAGTLRYMSPEQIQGKPLDHRSDVFSLGCSLFELVSYAPAFDGSTKEIVTHIAAGPVPSLLDLSPTFDRRLDDIIRRSMALEPSERYDDLEEMRADLARVRGGVDAANDVAYVPPMPAIISRAHDSDEAAAVDTAMPTRAVAHRRAAWWRGWPAIAGAVAAVVVAGTVTVILWNGRTSQDSGPPAAVTPVTVPSSTAVPEVPRAPVPTTPTIPLQPEDEVWRRLARGDRAGVLQWLSNNSRDAVVTKAVVDNLRASVMQTREAATASPTARSTQSYRSAEDYLARSNRLASSARPLESLRALWQAADAYASSLNAPSVQATSPAEPQPAAPAAVPPPSPAPPPTPTADVSSTAAAPVSSTTAPRPLPTPTPTVEDKRPSDSQAIANTLRSYDAAYRALDVAALLKVFPSLGRDQVETLRRTFAGMSTYEMETRVTRVDVNNDSASVVATVARRMTPRVGNPVVNDVETEFQLRRSGRDWVIVGVRVR